MGIVPFCDAEGADGVIAVPSAAGGAVSAAAPNLERRRLRGLAGLASLDRLGFFVDSIVFRRGRFATPKGDFCRADRRDWLDVSPAPDCGLLLFPSFLLRSIFDVHAGTFVLTTLLSDVGSECAW